MKRCTKCWALKPPTEFYQGRTKPRLICKACSIADGTIAQRKWRAKNRVHHQTYMAEYRRVNKARILEMAIKSHYRRKFGMTPEEKQMMLQHQEGRCAICGTTNPKHKKGFVVDHNHQTGRVRAILCAPCNTGLGHFRHSAALLEAASYYMDAHDVIDEPNT